MTRLTENEYWEGERLINFTNQRFNHLIKNLDFSFKDKKVLELGCGWGKFGHLIEKQGGIVTSIDGREFNIRHTKIRYPHRECLVFDLNKEDLNKLGNFDIVFAFGVLYHLENPDKVIKESLEIAHILLIEGIFNEDTETETNEDKTMTENSITGKAKIKTKQWLQNLCNIYKYELIDITGDHAVWSDWANRKMFIIKK